MPQINNNRKWFPVILLLFLTVTGIGVSWYYYRDFEFAFYDGFINALFLSVCLWSASFVTRDYPTHVAAIFYSILVGDVAGYLSWSLTMITWDWVWSARADFLMRYESSQFTRLLLHVFSASWVISLHAFKKRNDDLEERINLIADAATLHKEAELFNLRQQIQPHFLYNSLNSINALIAVTPDKAQEMVGKLSDFLRASVKKDAQLFIALEEELKYIENYLAIESVRFADRLHIQYENKIEGAAFLPSFLLQPILENAIKFGLYGNLGEVTIAIRMKIQDGLLVLEVENPFDETLKTLPGTGFGLKGIARRLYLLFGRNDLLETETENHQFITRIKIPQENV